MEAGLLRALSSEPPATSGQGGALAYGMSATSERFQPADGSPAGSAQETAQGNKRGPPEVPGCKGEGRATQTRFGPMLVEVDARRAKMTLKAPMSTTTVFVFPPPRPRGPRVLLLCGGSPMACLSVGMGLHKFHTNSDQFRRVWSYAIMKRPGGTVAALRLSTRC